MLNLLNKSVKTINSGLSTIVNGITSENAYKTEIDFCKFSTLQLNYMKNFEKTTENDNYFDFQNNLQNEFNVLFIIHSKCILNLYLINDDLSIKCFFSNKFPHPINIVEPLLLNSDKTYAKELPICTLISNVQKNEAYLKFYSLKSKRVVHNTRFKKKILNFVSKVSFYAVSFIDGSIKIFENDKMSQILYFMTVNSDQQNSNNNSYNSPNQVNANYNQNLKQIINNQNDLAPIFDISENYILYYNYYYNNNPEKDFSIEENDKYNFVNLNSSNSYRSLEKAKKVKKKMENSKSPNKTTLENMTNEAFKRI